MSLKSSRNPVDRIIVSSDANPKFLPFWPIIKEGWQRIFPKVPVHLALVCDSQKENPYSNSLKEFGNVTIFPVVPDIPSGNQAKMARYYLASFLGDEAVTMLNDIDLLPVNKQYFHDLLSSRVPGCLLTVGAELYIGAEFGKFTAGYLTAEGDVWAKIVNPHGLSWPAFVQSLVGAKLFDNKEDISNGTHHEDPNTFSDESVMRMWLYQRRGIPVQHRERGFYPYTAGAICRTAWDFNPDKIKDGTIKEAHLLRPYDDHKEKIDELVNFLRTL